MQYEVLCQGKRELIVVGCGELLCQDKRDLIVVGCGEGSVSG